MMNNINITRNDYTILIELYNSNCITELKAFTVINIHNRTNLSMNKVRQSLNKFKQLGFVSEGILNGKAKTYYITNNGIDKINKII